MARSRDISKVLSSSTALATDAEVSATYSPISTTGLILIHSSSFTSQATINIDNCFSSTYDHYKIIVSTSSGGSYFALRGRTGAVTNSSAFHSNATYSFRSGNAAAVDTANEGATSMAILAGVGNGIYIVGDIDNPFSSSKELHITHTSLYVSNSAGYNTIACWGGARVAATTSFDGLALLFGTSATGTVKIYGCKN